ncbi:hypothetical protein ACJMK2_023495 [Sinanodonta woodiana]|uniref:DUF4371 domain-containing protein n=1 Tax=Sinanodonta woodiana TaxID=1069815 RepID=A0ABD3T592_SINWO
MPCKTIAAHFSQAQQSDAVKQADSIMNAEIGMAEMITELNLPLSTADAMVQFLKNSFPDSKIAQGMQCGRSKTTAIVKHLAATAKLTLSDRMRTGPFSISTDGSNDADAKKFPIVVRTFNEETGQVCSELLAMPVCQGSASGENIFSLLHAAVMEARAPWTNCIALGVDNANVMTGANKGVYHFVKEKHDHVFLAGCTLHIVHNAAKKAAGHLPNLDEVLLDVYHYFNKSSSRQDRFKGDQELCGLEEKRMLKHVCTRWLSITRCLERMLKNWDALKVFFSEEKKAKHSLYAKQKVESIFQFIKSPTNKLFGIFLKYVHKDILEGVLVVFQSEEPQIHLLQPHLKKLLRRTMTCFVCNNHIRGKDVNQILYKDPNNQKNNELIMIGDEARDFLKQKEENHLRDSRIDEFFNTLPLEDPVLQHASVVNVDMKHEQSPSSLSFFLDRYPCLLPPGAKKQQIMQQFNEYQCCDLSSCKKIRVDETWTAIGQQRDETGELAFKELSQR